MSLEVIFFCCLRLLAFALDFLEAGIERGGDGVPEVEEGVLVEADVHEHRLEAGLDVFDAALEDAADDVLVAFALDGVFFEHAVFEQGDAAFEFFDVDDDAVSARGVGFADAKESFDVLDHGDGSGVDFNRCEVVVWMESRFGDGDGSWDYGAFRIDFRGESGGDGFVDGCGREFRW